MEKSALEALKKLQDSKLSPDIIFLDYNMSYLDGSVFLKLLRDIKSLKKIAVVLYSRNSGVMLQDALSKFKKVQFLKKHSNFRKLFESLQKIVISEKSVKKRIMGLKLRVRMKMCNLSFMHLTIRLVVCFGYCAKPLSVSV